MLSGCQAREQSPCGGDGPLRLLIVRSTWRSWSFSGVAACQCSLARVPFFPVSRAFPARPRELTAGRRSEQETLPDPTPRGLRFQSAQTYPRDPAQPPCRGQALDRSPPVLQLICSSQAHEQPRECPSPENPGFAGTEAMFHAAMDQTPTIWMRASSPRKSSGLRVYSASRFAWAVAAMSKSATRRRCERPLSATAATTCP
jgi:hypothetical protein